MRSVTIAYMDLLAENGFALRIALIAAGYNFIFRVQ